jgi:antitoxin HicB
MKYHFKIHRDKDGLWSECIELKGCVTQANSIKELKINMQEALNLYLDEPENSKLANPTLLKLQKLKEIFPNLRLDLLFY